MEPVLLGREPDGETSVAVYGALRCSQCCWAGSLMLEPGLLSMEPSSGTSAVGQGA
jgi:hypothetical protein